jgi:type IV secretory pathway protease TraF
MDWPRFSGGERAILLTAMCLALGLFGLFAAGLRVNLSRSHPSVLFWALPADQVEVGDLVVFCLPFRIEDYPIMRSASRTLCAKDQSGTPVLKRVAAVQADGDLWVMGSVPGSLDSEVFGAIPPTAIRYRVIAIW